MSNKTMNFPNDVGVSHNITCSYLIPNTKYATMAIPVKFYSVTPEEYDRIRQKLEHGVDGSEEAEQRKRDLEGGVFFVEGNK